MVFTTLGIRLSIKKFLIMVKPQTVVARQLRRKQTRGGLS